MEIKDEKRRNFLKTAGGLVGLGICSCVFSSLITACDTDEEIAAPSKPTGDFPVISIADYPALAATGGIVQVVVIGKDGNPVNSGRALIIYRADSTKFAVLDSLCLHKSQDVNLKPNGDLICSAHAAKFDKADGKTLDNGSAGETVPPLRAVGNTFDSVKNELTIKI